MRPDESMHDTPRVDVAIAGGGPAGLVLGLLLARAGLRVTVFEKHRDFLRDFRGDTVHPSTLDLLDDLGLFPAFDAIPHTRVTRVGMPGTEASGDAPPLVDFARLRVRHPYIAMVPQWDLLDLLAAAAAAEPGFELRMAHEVTGLVTVGDKAVGIEYRGPNGTDVLLAELVVACDGRHSAIRSAAALPARRFRVPFDAWWFRVETDTRQFEGLLPRIGRGSAVICIPRRGYLQIAYLGPKGTDAELRERGIEALREEVASLLDGIPVGAEELPSMDVVKHLDVRVDRLRRWWAPGLLCIGDAAHAMSPVGGVGINLAVQDAVATARILAEPLRRGSVRTQDLARVQRRRAFPTRATQALQRILHARLIRPVLAGRITAAPRAAVRLMRTFPALAVVPAHIVGLGVRPERAPEWARRARIEP